MARVTVWGSAELRRLALPDALVHLDQALLLALLSSTEDLTVDYEGDHSKARLADTVTLCRSHHGQKDGAKARASF